LQWRLAPVLSRFFLKPPPPEIEMRDNQRGGAEGVVRTWRTECEREATE
jgi:hypothetical protein